MAMYCISLLTFKYAIVTREHFPPLILLIILCVPLWFLRIICHGNNGIKEKMNNVWTNNKYSSCKSNSTCNNSLQSSQSGNPCGLLINCICLLYFSDGMAKLLPIFKKNKCLCVFSLNIKFTAGFFFWSFLGSPINNTLYQT